MDRNNTLWLYVPAFLDTFQCSLSVAVSRAGTGKLARQPRPIALVGIHLVKETSCYVLQRNVLRYFAEQSLLKSIPSRRRQVTFWTLVAEELRVTRFQSWDGPLSAPSPDRAEINKSSDFTRRITARETEHREHVRDVSTYSIQTSMTAARIPYATE